MLEEFDPNIRVEITTNAKNKINDLSKNNEFVRLYIIGGGCSGFQYMFDIVNERDIDDIKIPNTNLLIDPLSYQYIEGSIIDYTQDLMGKKFIVSNPLAKTTCGCGQSFSL